MVPLGEQLRQAAIVHRQKTAVITPEREVSYIEMNERVNRLANALLACGVKRGDRVAVMDIDSLEYVEMTYAVARIEAAYIPVNYKLRDEEVVFQINDSEPVLFAVGQRYQEMIAGFRSRLTSVQHYVALQGGGLGFIDYNELIASGAPTDPGVPVAMDDMLTIQYSSGTTGLPKGAILSQKTVMARMISCLIEIPKYKTDVFYNGAPFFHVTGALLGWITLARGATLVLYPQFQAQAVADLIQQHKVTAAFLVPSMINFIVNLPDIDQRDLSSLRLVEYGAAPMPVELLRKAMQLFGCGFVQMFGAGTEGGLQSVLHADDHANLDHPEALKRLTSAGIAPTFLDLRVVNEAGEDVTPGEVGEIISRGDMVMHGYWKRPEATAEAIRDGWLYAGDMGTFDEDGYLYILDRKKDMIIRGGENIYPVEIEKVLYAHKAVVEAAVIGVPDEEWGESVKAIVALRQEATATAEELMEFCRQRLGSYKKPTSVDFVEALPRNASGKVLKRVLREPFWKHRVRNV